MSATPRGVRSDSVQEHPYPIVRSGGLFLVLIGLGLIAGVAFSGAALVNQVVFVAGAGLGLVALMFAGRMALGRPTRVQLLALVIAILLELVLFYVMDRLLPPGTDESVRWMWGSIIVGVHFLPMAISFGPRLLALGAFCIVNAVAGLLLTRAPAEMFLLLDGTVKVAFGAWLFSEQARGSRMGKHERHEPERIAS